MKASLLLMITVCLSFGVTIILKNGTTFQGDVICQKKGSLVLKSDAGTVSLLKKSIGSIDSLSTVGAREITIPDSLILVNKNELAFINESNDSATVRLRYKSDSTTFDEKVGGPSDTLLFLVPNGEFYETVKYHRGENTYYTKGNSFIISSSCKTYMKQLVTIKGYPGTNVPRLNSIKELFERP